MSQVAEQETSRAVWCWRFDDKPAMTKALWEYNSLADLIVGRSDDGGVTCPAAEGIACSDCGAQDSCSADRHIMARCSEIDLCMDIMREIYPRHWRLLDLYYRQDLGHDPRGWLLVLKRDGSRNLNCPRLPGKTSPRCPLPTLNDEPEDTRLDIPKCRAMVELWCNRDQSVFKRDLDEAASRLMAIHKRRWEKMPT